MEDVVAGYVPAGARRGRPWLRRAHAGMTAVPPVIPPRRLDRYPDLVTIRASAGTKAAIRAAATAAGVTEADWLRALLGDAVAEIESREAVRTVRPAPVASVAAEVEEPSIAAGGQTFIVVTLTDAAGNPVADELVSVDVGAPTSGITLPRQGGSLVVVPQNSTTDADGRCVIRIEVPDKTCPADSATRATHVVTIKAAALGEEAAAATVEIAVAGPPASIASDAPSDVEPLSETKITGIVLDDAGVRVGAVPIRIEKIEGDGEIVAEQPHDGQYSFTYRAPPRAEQAIFLVRAGAGVDQISEVVIVAVDDGVEINLEGSGRLRVHFHRRIVGLVGRQAVVRGVEWVIERAVEQL